MVKHNYAFNFGTNRWGYCLQELNRSENEEQKGTVTYRGISHTFQIICQFMYVSFCELVIRCGAHPHPHCCHAYPSRTSGFAPYQIYNPVTRQSGSAIETQNDRNATRYRSLGLLELVSCLLVPSISHTTKRSYVLKTVPLVWWGIPIVGITLISTLFRCKSWWTNTNA